MVGIIIILVVRFFLYLIISGISAYNKMQKDQRFAQEYYNALMKKRRVEMRLEQTKAKLNKMLDN